jgi:hypothetical protein
VFGQILVEFLFRLTFGVATAMCLTPSKWVTSGFYRVHLWGLLGIQTLTALALYSASFTVPGKSLLAFVNHMQFWFAVAAASVSYIGAVIWMYERRMVGKITIAIVAGYARRCVPVIAIATNRLRCNWQTNHRSLLLGLVTTAMLLGHWYLNTPTMKLGPLKRLIVLLGVAVLLRAAVCAAGTCLEIAAQTSSAGLPPSWSLFVTLRWLAGIAGVLAMAAMTWQTLKIPNTQSATGIL